MAIFNLNKKRILKLISDKKDFLASVIALVLFSLIGTFCLGNINPKIESIPNYNELTKNPYESYEKITNRRNIKRLISNKQFIEMEYDENLIKVEYSQKRDDLFLKSF
ncbi:hypothetical protein KAI56_03980 [Candidatus Parcubacteria bacterium]|nr:hypothetical protein [Candidatus Parcubacteria bacterium]